MRALRLQLVQTWERLLIAINHAFGGIGLWLILDELGIIQAIKFHFMGMGGGK